MTQVAKESDLAKEVRSLPHVKSALYGLSQLRIGTQPLIMAIDDMLRLFEGQDQFSAKIPTNPSALAARLAKSTSSTSTTSAARASSTQTASQRAQQATGSPNGFAYGST